MKVSTLACMVAVALGLFISAGCDSKQESAQKKMVSYLNEYADVLDGIQSKSDIPNAKSKLEKIGAKMNDLAKEMKDMPEPSAEEQKKLSTQFEADSKKASERIMKNMERLAKLGVSPVELGDAMKLNPAMMP